MKKLSQWAKINPTTARIFIVIGHLLAMLNALFFGVLLFIFNKEYSWLFLVIMANIFFVAYFLYPKKGKKKGLFRYSYARQKLHDFTLVLSCSLAIALGFNNLFTQTYHNYSHNYSHNLTQPTARLVVHKTFSKEETKSLKSALKVKAQNLRKEIRHELRALKKELKIQKKEGDQEGLKVLLILLTIGLALLLAYVIAALSCSLSCSGNEGLAVAVLVLGWGGILWLGILAIKNILKMEKKQSP